MRLINKNIILIGPEKSGKRAFVDSLGYLEITKFETNYVSNSQTRKQFKNLKGEKCNQYFNILIPFEDREFDAINLKILKCRPLVSPSGDQGTEINYDFIDDFLYSLSEDINEDFHSILFFHDGVDVRLSRLEDEFFKKLTTIYGESILKFVTIIQSKSNLIKEHDFKFEECKTKKDMQLSIEDFEKFYNERVETRKAEFYRLFLKNTSEIRDRFPNCPNFEKSQKSLLEKISYLEFGKLDLNLKKTKTKTKDGDGDGGKEVTEVFVTKRSVPGYPSDMVKNFEKLYKNQKSLVNVDWLDMFIEKIYSLESTFNFRQIDNIIKEIKEKEKKSKIDYDVTTEAIKNAEKKFDKSKSTIKWKVLINNAVNALPLVSKYANPFNNLSTLSALTENSHHTDLVHVLKMVNDNLSDGDSLVYKEFFQEVKNQEIIIRLAKYGEVEPE